MYKCIDYIAGEIIESKNKDSFLWNLRDRMENYSFARLIRINEKSYQICYKEAV